jgi:hypothetical protein
MIPSERSKSMLKQLQEKKINEKDFLMECAYWALAEGFDELKPRELPLRPERVVELERKYTIKEKNETDWLQVYRDYPEVKAYYEIYEHVKHWNENCQLWLKDMLSYLPEQDKPNREKIEVRLKEFNVEEEQVTKVKETFSGHVVKQA